MKNKESKRKDFYIPGLLLVGLGVGFLTNQIVACMLIGLGLGILISAFDRK